MAEPHRDEATLEATLDDFKRYGIHTLPELMDIAATDLEAFLNEVSYPVLLAGPLATARLDDPTHSVEEITRTDAFNGLPASQVIPLRQRQKGPNGRLWLGRGTGCDVMLPFATVSRVHASVSNGANGKIVVADAGSRNGTWLNGKRLEAGVEVLAQDDDIVRFGSLELRILMPETLYWYLRGQSPGD